ncbi:MAG TPA: recombinase RecB, partial [Pseudonocardiaceae bacterium]|nr:recombinase RecB [Pseudonocardiaceae bacterium]
MDSAVLLDAGVVTRCRRRVHLDHDPAAADISRAILDPTAERRIADAAAHRRWVADSLAQRYADDWREIAPDLSGVQRC